VPPTAFDTTGSASSENIRCQTGCTSDDFDRTHHIRSFLYAVAPTFIRTPGTEDALANPQFRKEVIEHIAACIASANLPMSLAQLFFWRRRPPP